MSQAGSLGVGTFDLNSQSGVMAVLAAVRNSVLSSSQKAEIRDLVFLYTNGGGDVTVRRALEQRLATYGVTAKSEKAVTAHASSQAGETATTPSPAQPRSPYGTARPAPRFVPSKVVASVTTGSPTSPLERPVEQSLNVSMAPGTPAPAPSPAAVDDVPLSPAPVQSTPSLSPEIALARVREIKAVVNQRVGNPVNIVDIDNTIGRAYMVAVLDAMKAVTGSVPPGDLAVIMERLEVAFAAVMSILPADFHVPPPATSVPNPNPPSIPAAPVQPANTNPTVPSAPTVTPAGEPVPAAVAAPVAGVRASSPPVPPPTPPYVVPTPLPQTPDAVTAVPVPGAEVSQEYPRAPLPPTSVGDAAAPQLYAAQSLAEDPLVLKTPADLPDPASVAHSSVVGDPLYTKEVDDGLQQVLCEWKLFEKSGLFGTGPRGREHPLFKTLAPLSIPVILAGRYDGDSPKIRQDITDYMNGWRYEQGIVYNAGETFEHYLRRVIHHILELQKRRHHA